MERLVWKPNMSSSIPLYKQIESYIKKELLMGNGQLELNYLHKEIWRIRLK